MSEGAAAILVNNEPGVPTGVVDTHSPISSRPKPTTQYVPEGSQKRELSIGSTPSPSLISKEGKRPKHNSIEFDSDMEPEPEPEVSNADIMKLLRLTAKVTDLEDVAKKSDLIKLQETVSSHAIEIKQLREDIVLQAQKIKNLEDTLGVQVANSLNRTQPDVDRTRWLQHGGAQSVNNIRSNERRQNLVFEGIPILSEPEVEAYILQLCTTLGIVTFPSDIDAIVPMKRRDQQSKRPPPLLVTFSQQHVRVGLLKRKHLLAKNDLYKEVYINPDEPVEIRRNKAIFRRIAYKVRQDGKTAIYRDDWIQIEDTTYRVADLDKIPDCYKLELSLKGDRNLSMDQDTSSEGATGGARPKEPRPQHSNESRKSSRAKPFTREKVKLTKAGYAYSGPSAFLSHMYNCDFVHLSTPYTSVEQGYHHTHATHEMEFDTAEIIMSLYNAQDIKIAAKNLPDSEEWEQMSPGVLWDLNKAKFDQNPDLKQRLIETAPHKLVEASVDSKWGGGCPYGSDIYEQGQVPGKNVAGEQLTVQRDGMIQEMKEP